MSRARRAARAAVLGAGTALLSLGAGRPPAPRPASPLAAHPLHTSLTTVGYDPASRTLRLSVRVFADDFLAAARAPSPESPGVRAYLAATLVVAGPDGRALPFATCGSRRVGDLLWLCLQAPVDERRLSALRIRAALLAERFPDQINVVQAEVDGQTQSLLFTRGDGAKALVR